jgi:hypothetical protein
MTDEIVPGQPVVPAPAQPDNWEARYKGSVSKIEELTLANRSYLADQAAKTSEIEQLRAQLGIKDVEKAAAIGERDKQLQATIQTKTAQEQELADLRAFKLKVEVAKEIGQPGLLKILDKLPNMTDREALKGILTDFANFANDAAADREKQLMAGVTPPLGGSAKAVTTPTSAEGWEKHINSLPIGSIDRKQAFDDYWVWAETNSKK